MVSRSRQSRKSDRVRFLRPAWDEHSWEYQAIDSRLPPNHLARRIAQAVAGLDLHSFVDSYVGQGSPAYPPELLVAAVLYEMHLGKRSPAEWSRDARESQPVRWLLRGCQPSRSRWYAFRDRCGPWLDPWNRQVLEQALSDGLTPAQRGALDGTLTAANASRHRLLKEARLGQRLQQLHEVLASDQAEQPPTTVPGWMAKTASGRQQQQARYRQAQTRMQQLQQRNQQKRSSKRKAREKIVISASDVEAALGRDKQGVYRPLYNVQLIDDLDSPLILAYEVFAQPNDQDTLGAMLEQHAHLLGHKPKLLLADSGYASDAHLAVAEAAGVTLYAPWQENDYSKSAKTKYFPKKEFSWLADEQSYRCPQGQRLSWVGSGRQKRSGTETVTLHQYRCSPEHCRACPLKEKCTSNPEAGRTISRSEHEHLIEALKRRMQDPEAKALYRLRRQTIELAHADIKEHRKLRRFSGRGRRRVRIEIGLEVLVHNLLTLHAARPPQTKGEPVADTEEIAA